MIDLTIKTLDSQNHKFKVPDTFTVLELKEHIADQVKVAVVQQRLIFCGRVLSNELKLAEIGIDGKVMHLVQKLPRLATTTTGSSSSTTTNTNSRSGSGFRGWHSHVHDPTVLFGAIGFPADLINAGDLPRLMNSRHHGTGSRLSIAMDMIRKSNEILNRLENPRTNNETTTRPSAADVEQFPEELQQTEVTPGNVPESSAPPLQSDPDSVNVSYEVDETFPNTVVVTIDATHTMRMPPGLMRQMQNRFQGHNSSSQTATEQSLESEAIPTTPTVVPTTSNNQSSANQASESLPSSEQILRNGPTQEQRHAAARIERGRMKELIDQLNRLNARLEPFYALYCQYISEDPHFEAIEGDNGSNRAQLIFNGVSEVMHLKSHVYHAMSDIRMAFNRPRPRILQSRSSMLQGTILHHHQTITTSATSPPPPPPPSSQLPTSTQTTYTNQSIPIDPTTITVDLTNPEEDSLDASTSATENNTSVEYSSEAPHGVELMFDLTPGSIRIDSVEAAFVNPSGSNQPTTVSQPSSGNETSNNLSMPLDWMDQMIDVISSGVRRPFMTDQTLDWGSIPTTSTHTPRVTPRTTDSSSTTNSPSQGISRGRWDSPRMDPFLPCSSHHFEPSVRPTVLARRSAQGTDRSTTSSANSGNSTTDTSTFSLPTDMRPLSLRRTSRPRARLVQESADGLLAGIHPIIAWGRNHRNNTATSSASNITPNTLSNTANENLREQIIRVGMANVFDHLETEINLDRARARTLEPEFHQLSDPSIRRRQVDDLLHTIAGNVPFLRRMEGRYILLDLFLLIAGDWTLFDIINLTTDRESSIVRNPISVNCGAIINFVLERIMRNQSSDMPNIEEAANRIYQELASYINIFQCSVPMRSSINVNESFLRCITHHLRALVYICEENRTGASSPNDIVLALNLFAGGLISLIVYCCTSRSVFRLSVIALVQFLPLPSYIHEIILDEIRFNIDRYWTTMSDCRMLSLSVVDFIVPNNDRALAQTSRGVASLGNNETSTNPTLPSSEIVDEPLPEVVIGSQEWHHSVPSEWVPVITRDSQRQRRQGTQPPYSDAYLSGMPNKRRKIVTNSKPQGSLSQIIAKNLEVAMGAAGVTIKKEVTTSVGADTEVQSAYAERIRSFGRSGLDTHPDFCPSRYPNASKFFYDPNHPN